MLYQLFVYILGLIAHDIFSVWIHVFESSKCLCNYWTLDLQRHPAKIVLWIIMWILEITWNALWILSGWAKTPSEVNVRNFPVIANFFYETDFSIQLESFLNFCRSKIGYCTKKQAKLILLILTEVSLFSWKWTNFPLFCRNKMAIALCIMTIPKGKNFCLCKKKTFLIQITSIRFGHFKMDSSNLRNDIWNQA